MSKWTLVRWALGKFSVEDACAEIERLQVQLKVDAEMYRHTTEDVQRLQARVAELEAELKLHRVEPSE